MNDPVIIWVLTAISCAVVGAVVGEAKQASWGGFWWGLLFGPLGVLVSACLDGRPLCPMCGGRLNGKKERPFPVCQHCGALLNWQSGSPTVRQSEPQAGTAEAGVAPASRPQIPSQPAGLSISGFLNNEGE